MAWRRGQKTGFSVGRRTASGPGAYYAGKEERHKGWDDARAHLECGEDRRFLILFSPTRGPRGKGKCQSGDARRTPNSPTARAYLPCRRNIMALVPPAGRRRPGTFPLAWISAMS